MPIPGEGKHMNTTKEQVAAGVITWARRMGSDTDNVRDAAHEASHAIEFGCARWDRGIDKAAFAPTNRRLLVSSEVDARAVERIVCEELGVPYVPHYWANICLLEQAGLGFYRAFPPTPEALVSAIEQRMERDDVLGRAAVILSLGMGEALP
jgi:hypothetical protein